MPRRSSDWCRSAELDSSGPSPRSMSQFCVPVPMPNAFRKQRRLPRSRCARLKGWTRERFALPDDASVFVAEVACGAPGCPPLDTVVAFWTERDRRHHFKVFKPVAEVTLDDLPPAWMKNALVPRARFRLLLSTAHRHGDPARSAALLQLRVEARIDAPGVALEDLVAARLVEGLAPGRCSAWCRRSCARSPDRCPSPRRASPRQTGCCRSGSPWPSARCPADGRRRCRRRHSSSRCSASSGFFISCARPR